MTVDGSYLADRYQYFLSQQAHVFDGARELLERLKEQEYRLFAATNGVTFIQKGRLTQSGIGDYFEQIFISDELGCHKPNKDFFDSLARKITNFSAHQALMVGDSLAADIKGGNEAGIDTVFLTI